MPCTHSNHCELYVQFAADPLIKVWKENYCEGSFDKCARYLRSLRGESVPITLLPNGKEILDNQRQTDVSINAIFNAVQKNRLPMIQAIMKAKTDDNVLANSAGITPTMFAASLGRVDILTYFLENGCNPHHKCGKGKTALDYAQNSNQSECIAILQTYMAKVAPPKETANTSTLSMAQEERAEKHSLFSKLFGMLKGKQKDAA